MPIDTSMYQNMRAPDILGNVQRGLQLRELINTQNVQKQQMQENQAIKDVFKSNIDASGKVNKPAVLAGIAKINPQKALAYEKQFAQLDESKTSNQMNTLRQKRDQLGLISQVAGSVKDQQTYDQALQVLNQSGVDTSQMPRQYDPRLVSQYGQMALTAQNRMDQQFRQQQLGLQREELGIKRQAAKAKAAEKSTPGQKRADQEFAKEYNSWTSGGRDTANSEIAKLQSVVNNLESGAVETGGLTGILPDRMTSNAILSARADVQSTIMNSLRAILGAQFTEKEGERVIKNTWNEADSTQNNLGRLKRLVNDLTAKSMAKDEKAKFFENSGGTLAEYKAPQRKIQQTAGQPPQSGASGGWGIPEANAGQNRVFKTNEIEWAD